MSDQDLRRALVDAVGPVANLDAEVLRRRVAVRQRRRTVGSAVAAGVIVVLVAVPLRGALQVPEPVELAAGRDLVEGEAPAGEGVPALTAADRLREPTRLPPGTTRCEGPSRRGAVTTTRYCTPDGSMIEVARGPHHTLPEVGEAIDVADRTGYLRREGGALVLTVSDADSMDDLHHRVRTDAGLTPGQLAEVMASIPAVAGP